MGTFKPKNALGLHIFFAEGYLNNTGGTSLVVQWLRQHAPNAGGPGVIPGQRTRSHMPQLKIPCAATKTWHSQIEIYPYIPQRATSARWDGNPGGKTVGFCAPGTA